MSSTNPVDFDLEYGFVDGETKLNATELGRRFLSVHQRLNAVETKGEGYDSLIEQGNAVALRRINEGVAPLLAALLAQIAAAETALDLLEAQIAGGISATQIRVSTISGLAATTVQGAIAELQADIGEGLPAAIALAGSIGARDLYLSNF